MGKIVGKIEQPQAAPSSSKQLQLLDSRKKHCNNSPGRNLAKVGVASSNLVSRSIKSMTYVWSVLVVPDTDPSCGESCGESRSGIKKRTLLSNVRFSGVGV